jgi:DNA-binding LacI/PurR family transcriptional regulator
MVDIDNVAAARLAVNYLIGLGHSQIAYFAGPSHSAHSGDRLLGYQQAHIEHHLPLRNDFIISVGSYIENSYKIALKFFISSQDLPTAVFCYNDLVAIGLINALLELNIHVPEQVSVIGFDNIDFCESVKIPLTTVHMPAYEIGKSAAELLIRQIENPDELLNEKIFLETRLIERSSCALLS